MRLFLLSAALAACACAAHAQRPTPADSARADSARADSLERARRDSILLVRELERIQGEPRARADTSLRAAGAQGPVNSRLLPDISAVGDLAADLSPDGSTLEDGRRFGVREVEVAIQANVDPYFRADFILGVHADALDIEEAYATTTSLPWALQARIGRVHLPFGKQNAVHRAELHTIEYPWVVQQFLGAEGGKGDGLFLSRVFAPLGFYQELQLGVMDRFGAEEEHGHEDEAEGDPGEAVPREPANKSLDGLGYLLRLRNYWDLTEAANLELSVTGATGRNAQPFEAEFEPGVNAVNARQSLLGADLTLRWRPLQQGLYRSLIVQTEWMLQENELFAPRPDPGNPGSGILYLGPDRDFVGGYAFARWQLTRRTFVAGRFDTIRDRGAALNPEIGRDLRAASGYLTWFPSEFSKLVLGYERLMPEASDATDRLLLQATFSVGPHRPHPF